ncbi:LanC-like protein 3 [Orchesella cincta]|uniref:LanC-like protein 3 homolog n=1 Tax=Orchesella cincta TaxID=48709 RepID=A0A1D2N9B4_ORCCI|nr:LanC-like protein 3 [Orchesella cincta]
MTFAFTRILNSLGGSLFSQTPQFPFNKDSVRLLQASPPARSTSQFLGVIESFLNSAMSRQRRWFDNPYPDYQPGNEQLPNLENVRKLALEKVEKVFEHGARDGDGALYVGAVGCAYMLLHIFDKLTVEERKRLLPLAFNAFQLQSVYFQRNPGKQTDEPGFLLGKSGHYAVGAVLGQLTGNQQLTNDCLQSFIAAANVCKPIDFFKPGGDEFLVGRSGYLCGALWLQQKLGYQPVPKEDLKAVWNAVFESGKRYSKLNKSPSPLMFSYYQTEYLGAAHGLSSILQILISFPVFLNENPEAATTIKASIDFYHTLQDQTGNFPCAMDELGRKARHPDEMLVHWCHGAPGAIYLFAKANKVYGEQKYLDACLKCGDLMWNRGLLRKGPGICHGVAGNGYVFLVLNRLLEGKDPKQLYRAGKFAEFLECPQFLKEANRPDCPYSLYEGWAGTVCFLMDLLQPEAAEFPFFNLDVNYA